MMSFSCNGKGGCEGALAIIGVWMGRVKRWTIDMDSVVVMLLRMEERGRDR